MALKDSQAGAGSVEPVTGTTRLDAERRRYQQRKRAWLLRLHTERKREAQRVRELTNVLGTAH